MSCTDIVCGTGGWTGPRPGDPDNNVILTAAGVLGGINIRWTYPSTNSHAVAHTILYRGSSSDFATAVQHEIVNGTFFFDRIENETPTTFYYWIRIVSINGTQADLIGPASATHRPRIAGTVEDLTGLIEQGVLAQSLQQEIDNITQFGADLIAEIQNRIAADDALGALVQQANNGVDSAMTLILNETNQRITADDVFAQQLQILIGTVNDNAAAIYNEQTLRVNEDEALAQQIQYTYAQTLDDIAAAVQVETTARTDADNALASQISTTQTALEGNIASVQTTLQSNIDTLDGEIVSIGALYTAKVQVNGLIGGFGVYNDGTQVEAGFDVDRFWIGKAGTIAKPFIIDGSNIYLNGKVQFSNVQGAGDLASKDSISYAEVTGTKPPTDWIKPSTTLIDGNKIFTGDAYVDTLQIQGNAVTVPATAGGIYSASVNVYLNNPGTIVAIATFVQGIGKANHYWNLTIGGQLIQRENPVAGTLGALSGAVSLPAGNHTVQVWCETTTGDGRCNVTALGAKR